MPQNNQARRRESGNAFAIIMIGVVLFGALMFTFSRGAKQGTGNLTRKRIEVISSDMIGYAQRMERGVNRLMSHSCSENFISFETASNPAYPVNADAPTDFTCHVFNPAGGGISPVLESSFGLTDMKIRPSGGAALSGIGTHDISDVAGHQDLVIWFENINQELCMELNRRMNFNAAIPVIADTQAWEFGTEPTTGQHWGTSITNLGGLSGFTGGCVERDGAPTDANYLAEGFSFFYVLYPR